MGIFNFLDEFTRGLTPGAAISRRAWLEVKYFPKGEKDGEGKDISEDVSRFALSLSYTDNMDGQVDDISLTLEDRAQMWLDEWMPEIGAFLDITLHTYNWTDLMEGEKTLHFGKFEIDEIEVEGMPSTVSIKGVSAVSESTLRGAKKNRTWENISIWKCADDICKENETELFWDCEYNPNLDHVEQSDESDLAFLKKICKDAGLSLKVTPEKVIIFDEASYEAKDASMTVVKPGSVIDKENGLLYIDALTGYHLKIKSRDIYKACHLRYQKGEDKEVIEAEFSAPEKKDGKTLEIDNQVSTQAEADALVKKKLREANREEFTGSVNTPGNFNLAAGVLVNFSGFGKADGKYIITKVHHEISGSYTTSMDVRRCLDGY